MMDKWIQLNNQTAGKDKLARLVQYTSRAIWDTLECVNIDPVIVENFKSLEYILSSFRKLLRFGKCLDLFYASLRSIHHDDVAIRWTLTISKLSQSLYLFADHFMWLARTGLLRHIDIKKWNNQANKYWLLSIIMNLCRDVYEIKNLLHLYGTTNYASICVGIRSPRDLKDFFSLYSMILSHKDIMWDTLKNICDLFIPLTALGYTNLTPRIVGLLGAISSIAALIALIDSRVKLVP